MLVFLIPLTAMALCAGLAVGVYALRPASAPRLPGTSEGPRPPGPETAAPSLPEGHFAVPGAPLLRSDRIATFRPDGAVVHLVYGDGHAVTLDRTEADQRLRSQTGRSLLDLMLSAP